MSKRVVGLDIENLKQQRRIKKMTKEMYEGLLERNKLQISELNTLTEEQDEQFLREVEE